MSDVFFSSVDLGGAEGGGITAYNQWMLPATGADGMNAMAFISGMALIRPDEFRPSAMDIRLQTGLKLSTSEVIGLDEDGNILHTTFITPSSTQGDDADDFTWSIWTAEMRLVRPPLPGTDYRDGKPLEWDKTGVVTIFAAGEEYQDTTIYKLSFQSSVPLRLAVPPVLPEEDRDMIVERVDQDERRPYDRRQTPHGTGKTHRRPHR